MLGFEIWDVLSVVAVIAFLIFQFAAKKSLWTWVIVGIVAGLIAGLIYLIRGMGFNWMLSRQIVIVAIFLGIVYEISGDLSGYNKGD